MFSEEELIKAKKLYFKIHSKRYDFSYFASKLSKDWTAGWHTVVQGTKKSTGKVFNPRLSNKAIEGVLFNGYAYINNGYKPISVEYLACTFGKTTQYFAVDIDCKPLTENPNYNIETVQRILEITKHIGTPVFMQSSCSKGWHLRWYFEEPVETWKLAVYLKELFESNGFVIEDGKLEIFPNKKSTWNSLYKGLRLPCQNGSALLSLDDRRVTASRKEDTPELFLIHWADEVRKHLISEVTISNILISFKEVTSLSIWREEYLKLKETGFTEYGQTNKLLYRVATGMRVHDKVSTIVELTKKLCEWMDKRNNGFCDEYNRSLRMAYERCKRVAKWVFDRGYSPSCKDKKNGRNINSSNKAKTSMYDHIIEKNIMDNLIKAKDSIRVIANKVNIPKSVIDRKKDFIGSLFFIKPIHHLIEESEKNSEENLRQFKERLERDNITTPVEVILEKARIGMENFLAKEIERLYGKVA